MLSYLTCQLLIQCMVSQRLVKSFDFIKLITQFYVTLFLALTVLVHEIVQLYKFLLTLFVFHCIIVFATPIISLNPLQILSYCYQFSFVKRTKRKIKDQFPVNNALHSDHTLSLWFIVFRLRAL